MQRACADTNSLCAESVRGKEVNMDKDNRGQGGGQGSDPKNRRGILICLCVAILVIMLFTYMNNKFSEATHQEISYDTFLQWLDQGRVAAVELDGNYLNIEMKEKNKNSVYEITYYTGYIASDFQLVSRLEKAGITFTKKAQDTGTGILDFFVIYVLPLVLLWVAFMFIFRMISKNSGGMMGVGKSTAKMYVQKETGVTFKDVAGQEEAMESLTELVDFLHNPKKYTDIGAKLPKGALLVGPPGTGKTLLAKAVAGEAGVPFFSLSGSDFVEMFVGVGASRVRDLFKQAQQMAPCIIFIDEIDAIGKSRDSAYGGGGNDEREQTLNQLLSEMDGFDTSKGLVILGATNRPEVLDKALLRPGRFDRRVIVEKPDLKGRVDVLKVHAKDVLMDDSVDFDAIALATSGAAGSDLANMINEAAIMAVKNGRKAVCQADLFEAVEVVIAGKEKKDRILGKEEKRVVAYHEVGHALVAALKKEAEPVQKITIVPRTMGSLGYVMHVPEEEKYLMSKEEILTRITGLFGGRAAEQVVFDSVTTGATSDIEKATSLARAMVTQYGMSEKFGLIGLESVESKYLDGRSVLNCGDATEAEIDQEVMKILKVCYDEAEKLLAENREVMDEIAKFLIERETITGEEFMKIFREVKGLPEKPKKEKEQYDAIVLDIDGTLSNSEKIISDKTKEILKRAQRAGKTVAIASGRSFAGIRHIADALEMKKNGGYVLAFNGGAAMNQINGKVIFNQVLPEELKRVVYGLALEHQVGIMAYRDENQEMISGNGIDEYLEEDAKACGLSIREAEDFLAALDYPVNKFLLSGDPEKMEQVEIAVKTTLAGKAGVYRSAPCFIEVVPEKVDKADGIERLLRHIGTTKEHVIAVGDSYNDTSMIRYAGLGVAMKNAVSEVKAAAGFITDSNDDDGIVRVIETFMPEVLEDV